MRFFTLIPIPPLTLAAQIVMKKWGRRSLFLLYNSYREATLQKHGEVSSRFPCIGLKQYTNQCKLCLPSTNKWHSESAT